MAAAILVAAAAGCTPAAKDPVLPEPSLGPVPTVTSRSQVVPPPLLQYKTTVDEQYALQQAAARLTVRCLARFGVVASPTESRREDVAAARAGAANRYGAITLDEAMAINNPVRSPENGVKSNRGVPSDPREAELLTGQNAQGKPSALRDRSGAPVPKYGCGREGWDQLGYRPDDLGMVDQLLNDSWSLMIQDSRFRDLEGRWTECMKGRGFDLKSRSEPYKSAEELQGRAKPDVECAKSVNYVGLANALDVAYQKRVIAQNAASLTAVQENNRSMVAKAQEVLRG